MTVSALGAPLSSPSIAVPRSVEPSAVGDELPRPQVSSYGQILKSSALIGGSSVVNIAVGVVRSKIVALLLGPSGVGLMGLYGSISDLAQNIAGMGISSSGVRQIAGAIGSGDSDQIARTVMVLRRTTLMLGALGGLLLIVFSRQVSQLTFGTDQHAGAVALLSLAVFLRCVSGGQSALIQGLRRISDLARISALTAVFGSLTTIVLIYFLRENGVVPSLVATAAIAGVASTWYARKITVRSTSLTGVQMRREAASLLKLGFALMASSFIGIAVAYLIRILIVREVGDEGAGFYQAAWSLGGLYIGFVLQAMGADFLPRLTAVATDPEESNRLVNEQALVSLLVAGPGVLAMLVLAPEIIHVLYSAQFQGAVGTLRWISLGMLLRAVTWPMSFVLVANNRKVLFVGADLTWSVLHVGIAYVSIKYFGLSGAGIAFFTSYVFYALIVYPAVRMLTGFRWSSDNKRVGALCLLSIALVVGCLRFLPEVLATAIGSVVLSGFGLYCLRRLLQLVPAERFPAQFQPLLRSSLLRGLRGV